MEPVLIALVAAAALTPVWLACCRAASPAARFAPPGAAGLLLALGAAAGAPHRPPPPDDRPLEQPAHGYVGSAACRSCHPGEHASWHASFHRSMTQPATRATIAAPLGPADRLELDCHGRPVVLEWGGDTLWVELDEPGAAPANAPRRASRPVVQVTGSHHAQVLWYSTGDQRELGAVPMVYRIAERRWLPIDAVFLMPPAAQAPAHGTWNGNCISCHTTHAMPGLDTGRTDTRAAEFGIACEACHGPGAAHAAANRNPLRRYALHLGGDDDTITDPLRLDADRQAEVCGQCHSVSIVRRAHFDSWREQGSPYRPGQRLDEAQLVVTPAAQDAPELRGQLQRDPHFFEQTFWPDGAVRVTGREFNGLLLSPCHTLGRGEGRMTCLSCHRMHQDRDDPRPPRQWADAQLAPGMDGNAACLQCHPELHDPAALAAHSHHGADSPGSSCMDCHMPRTAYGLLAAIRSHRIDSPSVQTELSTGRPNACNLCHLDRTLAWTDGHLQDWYGAAPAPLDGEQREVAAGVRWLLRGDAAQRALAAHAAGTAGAHAAGGTDWLPPYLGQLLADPYYAVRIVAARSLQAAGGALPPDCDPLAPAPAAAAAAEAVQAAWRRAARPGGAPRPELLLDGSGLQWPRFFALLARRDDRPVVLAE